MFLKFFIAIDCYFAFEKADEKVGFKFRLKI